jgi:hypothetical protein
MATRTLMSFDWAIKKVLRHKENFDVLEKRLFSYKICSFLNMESDDSYRFSSTQK